MGLQKPKYGYYVGDINDFLLEKKDVLNGWIADERENGSLVGFIQISVCNRFSNSGE